MKALNLKNLWSFFLVIMVIMFVFWCFNLKDLSAAPYAGEIFSVLQPDGSRVNVRIWGDEFYHRVESIDGYTLTRDKKKGWICYAKLPPGGADFISTGIVYRGMKRHVPKLKKRLKLPRDIILEKRAKKLQESNAGIDYYLPSNIFNQTDSGTEPVLPAPVVSGSVLGLTLLIDFPDVFSTITQGEIEDYLNQFGYNNYGCNGSVRDYFNDVSNGLLDYTNHVTAFYTAIHEKSYYTNPDISYGTRARELIHEALDYLENVVGFDFSTLSTDASNRILAINAFYAGYVDNAWAEGLWPHMSGLWPLFSADGVQSGAYQITAITHNLSLRTFCHENGHMLLGWPDLYDYGYESTGVGSYCLMCYGGNNDNPVPPCAYLRNKSGWESVIDITSMPACTTFSLTANSFTTYRYSHPTDSKEYFLIECRIKSGRNISLPDEGLMIWHIDEDGSNGREQMTCSDHYLVSLEQADGLFQLENGTSYGGPNDLFHAGDYDEFGSSTIPNSDWWCSGSSGFEVGDISAVGNQMSFALDPIVCNQPPVAMCTDVTVSADVNCQGNASINNGSYDPNPEDILTITQTPSGPYSLGNTLVTLTVVDNHGATDVCTATVTVSDTTAPIIDSSPITYTVCVPNAAVVDIQPPEITDTCSDDTTITIEGFIKLINCKASGMVPITGNQATLPTGEHVIEWRATDIWGNQATSDQTVYVDFMVSDSCCVSGETIFIGDNNPDFYYSFSPPACVLTYGGDDMVTINNVPGNYVALGFGTDRAILTNMSGSKNIIIGEEGNDNIKASFSNDDIYGGEGNDYINVDGGNNIIYGGYGNDIIYGGFNNDIIIPGPGKDIVYGSLGNDTVYVYDICELEFGEYLSGESGDDTLYLPVSLSEAIQLGVMITGFEHVYITDPNLKGFSDCVSP